MVLTLIAGLIMFAILGRRSAGRALCFFIEPVDNWYGVGELGVKATPLVLCAVGLSIGFRANIWNIGAEGQFVMGAVFGTLCPVCSTVAVADYGCCPRCSFAGAVGGALWGAIPAFLKTRFNANEILTSLMLNYVAALFLNYLVRGPWRKP